MVVVATVALELAQALVVVEVVVSRVESTAALVSRVAAVDVAVDAAVLVAVTVAESGPVPGSHAAETSTSSPPAGDESILRLQDSTISVTSSSTKRATVVSAFGDNIS